MISRGMEVGDAEITLETKMEVGKYGVERDGRVGVRSRE